MLLKINHITWLSGLVLLNDFTTEKKKKSVASSFKSIQHLLFEASVYIPSLCFFFTLDCFPSVLVLVLRGLKRRTHNEQLEIIFMKDVSVNSSFVLR